MLARRSLHCFEDSSKAQVLLIKPITVSKIIAE